MTEDLFAEHFGTEYAEPVCPHLDDHGQNCSWEPGDSVPAFPIKRCSPCVAVSTTRGEPEQIQLAEPIPDEDATTPETQPHAAVDVSTDEDEEPLTSDLPPVEITDGQGALFGEPEQVALFDMPPSWRDHWVGMPDYDHNDMTPWSSIQIHFACRHDRVAFAKLIGQTITDKTKSVWYPEAEIGHRVHLAYKSKRPHNPKYPVYVISKGRWEKRLTVKALERIGVPFHVVIEPQEYEQYAAVIDPDKILVLPFSNLGQGSIPARNWVWEHSISIGAERHWIMDDNIASFHRYHNNMLHSVIDGTIFRAAEDFTDRYENVKISGMQYFMFVSRKEGGLPAFVPNTRVYSCILIKNDTMVGGEPLRWRGRYNEDTDLCIRALKEGHCTVLFNAFLIYKMPTMTMSGGNTDELYSPEDGRLKMAESLCEQHPDVARVTWKWGRWQHHVNYEPFKKNKMILKPDAKMLDTNGDDWGMALDINPGYEDVAYERLGLRAGEEKECGNEQE